MVLYLQGVVLGFIMVLPGMSGGTVFVIFGIYEQLVRDLANRILKPYIPLLIGIMTGIYISGSLFAWFFTEYRDKTSVFLLGCLLASIRAVLKCCPGFSKKRIIFMGIGIVIGFMLGDDPIGAVDVLEEINSAYLFVAGALSSATMVLPGLPGSSVLIVMGVYDTVLFYLSELVISKLVIFGTGSITGMLLLVHLLEKLYDRYRAIISYFFAGLILGSSRALFPYSFSIQIVLLFLAGFIPVWKWSGK
ncbi:MAG: DUF368 domain-containing protein [Tindallia sp. MSAO_Bac2]|nr:MAG: DUF368 domain-containing protein [Tindallia sp. MSAO_Bac2]